MARCARHPHVETLRCATCGTPICPDCMVETPVGMKCPTCGMGIVLLGPRIATVLAGGRFAPTPAVLAVLTFRPLFLLFAAPAIIAAFWRTR